MDTGDRGGGHALVKRVILGLVPAMLIAGCAEQSTVDVCGRRTSLASVTGVLSQGVDAIAAETSGSLRLDILANQNILAAARVDSPEGVSDAIDVVLSAYAEVENALDLVDWDLSVAATDEGVQSSIEEVTTGQALVASATVESYLFAKCGAPLQSDVNQVAPATLPVSTQLGTDVTDPDTAPVDGESEIVALGLLIGNSFQLTLSLDQAKCLGEKVSDVVDYSNEDSTSEQYSSQYQRAFDACGIDFDVPA